MDVEERSSFIIIIEDLNLLARGIHENLPKSIYLNYTLVIVTKVHQNTITSWEKTH